MHAKKAFQMTLSSRTDGKIQALLQWDFGNVWIKTSLLIRPIQKSFIFLEAIKNRFTQPCTEVILYITDTNYGTTTWNKIVF